MAVLITGICGRLGRLVTRSLHRKVDVVGIDRREFEGRPKDVVHHRLDIRRTKTRDVFRAGCIDALVHLGTMHDPRESDEARHSWNVTGLQNLLDYAARYGVKKVVVLSSATIYGPSPDNPQFLTEDAPLLGAQRFSAIRDLMEVDMLAQNFLWKHPQIETVVLRPCHILGRVRNAPSNYLRAEYPLMALGFNPMVQVIHERDVEHAILLALEPGRRGIYNLRGPGELPLSRAFEMLGRRPIFWPAGLAQRALNGLWASRLTSFPAPELDHIRYVCMVDDTRARRELGYRHRYDMKQTVSAVNQEW
ncbi:MAG: SDR family oxidoreductase [Polyangiales bacterium]